MDTASAVSRHRNESHRLAPETEEVLRLIDEDRLDELRHRGAQDLAMERAAQALRALEERRQTALTPPDGLEQEAQKLAQEHRDAVAAIRNAPIRSSRFDWILSRPVDTAADGAFQWSTTTLVPMPGHFDVRARPEGGYFFTGRRRSVDTPLSFEVVLLAHYWLGFDHLPPSASGVWVSHPAVDLRGDVWAETLRGATSARCKMFRTQSLYHIFNGQRVPLAGRTAEQVVVETASLNSKRAVLEGLYSMPVIEFSPQLQATIWATLEIRFAGTVRGRASEVTIGTRPPEDGVVAQIAQWRAVPY